MNVSSKLIRLRQARGWSQSRLAKESGISQSFISQIEAGTYSVTVATLEKLCAALRVTLAEFFAPDGGEEAIPPELRRLLDKVRELTPEERAALEQLLNVWGKRGKG